MRDDIGETENEFRLKATESTDKLFQLLMKHHGMDDDDPPQELQRPVIETIQTAVAAAYGVTRLEIISDRRNEKVILPRHVAMYLCRELTPKSFPAIGRRFGDRDHTTVHSAIMKITRLVEIDPVLAAKVEKIRAGFEA